MQLRGSGPFSCEYLFPGIGLAGPRAELLFLHLLSHDDINGAYYNPYALQKRVSERTTSARADP